MKSLILSRLNLNEYIEMLYYVCKYKYCNNIQNIDLKIHTLAKKSVNCKLKISNTNTLTN